MRSPSACNNVTNAELFDATFALAKPSGRIDLPVKLMTCVCVRMFIPPNSAELTRKKMRGRMITGCPSRVVSVALR